MTIGERLAQARKQVEMTQQAVAEAVHVSRTTISNWETGRSFPDIASLITLSDLYGLSLDHLIKEDQAMVSDLKKKEMERRAAKQMYWGSYAVNLILMGLILANLYHVRWCR